MPARKNNHIIPKCLIKEWATNDQGREGVYVYDIKKDKIDFSEGKGSGAYSFAAGKYFYVPKINSQRNFAVENWLAGIENTFAFFNRGLKANPKGFLLKSEQEFLKLVLAVFSLKNRNKYTLEQIKQFIIDNPEYRELIGASHEDDIQLVVLENFINSTSEEAGYYQNCEIQVFRNDTGGLILGDRPLIHKMFDDYSFLPLGPNYLMAIRPSNKPPTYDVQMHTNESVIETFNKCIAQLSRNWIVSNKKSVLEKYIPFFKEEKPADTPYYTPVTNLKHGYKLI